MSRVLASLCGVSLIVLLVGCGGGGADDGSSPTTGGGTDLRAPAGTYTTNLVGTQTTGGSVSGSGTATVAADGTITMSYNATVGTATTARTSTVAVTTSGVASGSVVESGTTYALNGGTLAKNTDGTYVLSTGYTKGTGKTAITENDQFTLTAAHPPTGTYAGAVTGTDNKGGSYSGTGTLTVPSSGSFTLDYSSRRTFAGVSTTQAHTLSTAFGADGSFSGAMTVATSPSGVTVPVTGTWVLNSNGTVTLTLSYANSTYFPKPTVNETLTLAPQ